MSKHLSNSIVVVLCALMFVACNSSPRVTSSGTQSPLGPSAPSSGVPPATNSGDEAYSMTLTIGSSCAVVPEADRTLTYTATIASTAAGQGVATLSGATFLAGPICTAFSGGLGCNQFLLSDDAGSVQLSLANHNDDAHGGHIVQQLPSGHWLEIIGNAAGKSDSESIDASGSGSVWYCAASRSYPFPCQTVSFCQVADLRLQFSRN